MARWIARFAPAMFSLIVFCVFAAGIGGRVWGQGTYPSYPPPGQATQPTGGYPSAAPGGPDQPVDPQMPRLERRVPPQPYGAGQGAPTGSYPAPAGGEYQPAPGGAAAPSAGGPYGTPTPGAAAGGGAAAGPMPRAMAQTPPAPFDLTPEQVADVERVLRLWEQRSAGVKTFECRFKRWDYDRVFGPKDVPRYEDIGVIKYAAPDRGVFQVTDTVIYDPQDVERRNPRQQPIEPERAEHWICDGKSVFEYIPRQKTVNEYPLPPELQGKAIANSPLPFLFGSRADDLKRRYFLRIITPVELQTQQTWIEAYPRFQADAANFSRAILVLQNHNMQPFGMKVFATNGKNETSYQFFEIVVNDPLRFFKGDPFRAGVPIGWKSVVHRSNNEQAGRTTPPGTR